MTGRAVRAQRAALSRGAHPGAADRIRVYIAVRLRPFAPRRAAATAGRSLGTRATATGGHLRQRSRDADGARFDVFRSLHIVSVHLRARSRGRGHGSRRRGRGPARRRSRRPAAAAALHRARHRSPLHGVPRRPRRPLPQRQQWLHRGRHPDRLLRRHRRRLERIIGRASGTTASASRSPCPTTTRCWWSPSRAACTRRSGHRCRKARPRSCWAPAPSVC